MTTLCEFMSERRSVLGKALVQRYDEKWFEFGIGTSAEVLILPTSLYVKRFLRESISFELFDLVEGDFEAMAAVNRHEFDAVLTKMEPSPTVIHHVLRIELLV